MRQRTIVILLGIALAAALLLLTQEGTVTSAIRASGRLGVLCGILFSAVTSMTPIPSEGLVLTLMNVYGPIPGATYAWLGTLLGALGILLVTRKWAQPQLLSRLPAPAVDRVNQWVERRGAAGLLITRLLPVPAFLVSYVAALIPTVRVADYLWTCAAASAVYDIATMLVYVGFSAHWLLGVFIFAVVTGTLILALLWLRRR